MKIIIREKNDNYMRFVVEETDIDFMNMLRRTIISDIPKMAIEDVDFHQGPITYDGKDYESVTPLFNEIIAHRLGMLPIPTDPDLFLFRDECSCNGKGCPNCTIEYMLDVKGPKTVYSKDIKVVTGWFPSEKKELEEKLKIKYDNIPIVKLREGQALLVYATAILGTGKQHAKWQSTSGVGYKYYPIVKIDNRKCDLCSMCIKNCPRKILSYDNKKVKVEDIENCTMCKKCEDVCERNAISVSYDENKFIFKFETDDSITPDKVLKYAVKKLKEKLNEIYTIVDGFA